MVNRVVLIGYLGADPENRSTQNGQSVTNFSLATSESWKDKDGNKQEKTEWHKVQCWGNLADIVAKFCTKGKLVYVEGKIQTRKWQDKEGQDRYTTEIVAYEVKFLGGGSKDGEERQAPARQERPVNQARPANGGRGQPAGNDDDIPF